MARWVAKGQKAVRLALTNPAEFWRRLRAFGAVVFEKPARSGKIRRRGVVFRIDLALDPVMESMYYGTYQAELVQLMERVLQPGDGVVDVGANVGYVSAIALGLVGRQGQVHAFEPVPQYADRLRQVQQDNPRHALHINPVALSNQPGTATICVTNLPNIGWNTMVPQFMRPDTVAAEVEVPVTTLDHYLEHTPIPRLRLIKIDTEGYEFPILQGLKQSLQTLPDRPILIVEVAPTAYPSLGSSLEALAALMQDLGYGAWDMAIAHPIDLTSLTQTTDVVFLPKNPSA